MSEVRKGQKICVLAIALLISVANYMQYQLAFHIDCAGNTQDSVAMAICLISLAFCVLTLIITLVNFVFLLKRDIKRQNKALSLINWMNVLNTAYGAVFLWVIKEWENFTG